MEKKSFYFLTISCLLAFVVITLGAYVRLSDAGLGCPDWPGCYGKLIAPSEQSQIHQANEIYPERPVETEKAWKEMIHRYAAGILLILVAVITIKSWRDSEPKKISPDSDIGLNVIDPVSGFTGDVDGNTVAKAGCGYGAFAGWDDGFIVVELVITPGVELRQISCSKTR